MYIICTFVLQKKFAEKNVCQCGKGHHILYVQSLIQDKKYILM